MANPFIDLIRSGRLADRKGLKSAYRRAAQKIHPDHSLPTLGEEDFITLQGQYEEALAFLAGKDQEIAYPDNGGRGGRRDFFQNWEERENLELPFNRTKESRERCLRLDALMESSFAEWLPEKSALYRSAMEELRAIREERPPNDLAHLRQPLLYRELQPLIYDICRWESGGRTLHRRLIDRIAPPVLERMRHEGHVNLNKLLLELLSRRE